ncbi:hypothetical protein GCM10008107_13940 [Psychrosphaera saromensis]|uniref:Uncharacterized protein n=1 Tax=Psychrosphaera saromensis TaxID=716813 RepID=A0A2S7UTV2_9GAMM|nr:hypothetical protein [Psychrosphaera saromensis]PQJ53373.1 hypothetical protein BTO11_06610 [Psychrosphaera saromensis]GHB66062.1 hypothetical protein GCM10008107_13940 [Psychrosphaera saromensis]GLQ14850.1 hypothetical protein GCM10007917_23050 [Psychrosphaera saromensis]
MRKILILLLVTCDSFSCQLRDEERFRDHFFEAMSAGKIVAIAEVKRTYQRQDVCGSKKFCSDSGLVFEIKELLKGTSSRFVETFRSIRTSCSDIEFHPSIINEPREAGLLIRYQVGNDYLVVIDELENDFILVAGKRLRDSLLLINKYQSIGIASKPMKK